MGRVFLPWWTSDEYSNIDTGYYIIGMLYLSSFCKEIVIIITKLLKAPEFRVGQKVMGVYRTRGGTQSGIGKEEYQHNVDYRYAG